MDVVVFFFNVLGENMKKKLWFKEVFKVVKVEEKFKRGEIGEC